jgi:3-hydroxymyristoyl/3-hydroxydecanoyl-(acyl carrier protein) dehydratase
MRPLPVAGNFVIAPDDPCLDGHFPGRPVVPGVVLLDEALHLLCQRRALGDVLVIQQAKFLHPVLPAERVEVLGGDLRDTRLPFSCRVAGRVVVTGLARVA